MKNNRTPNRRAFVALLPATLLFAAPAFAQDVPSGTTASPPAQVTPPVVVPTVSEPAAPAPTAVAPTVVLPTIAPAEATATEAPAPTATRTTRAVTRTTHVARTAAPVAARAPAAVAPAPIAVTPAEPAPAPVTPAPVEAAAPAPVAPVATTETTTTTEAAPTWPWILAGLLVVLGAIGLFVMRRRRAAIDEDYYDEPEVATTKDEPAPIVAPIVASRPIAAEPAFERSPPPEFLTTPLAAANDAPLPVASEDAALAEPEAAEVAELTAGDAPVADRPWLEFALRPIRAGISADEALVEFELTVGNSGSVKAKDVRISTFLFAGEPGTESEMERILIERGEDHDEGVRPVTIEPGEGTRVDATLALPKAQLIETTNGSILPVVVADARYTLADGSEGRTAASFTIGVSEEGTPAMSPLSLAERGMHDEVEARLYGVPEHA